MSSDPRSDASQQQSPHPQRRALVRSILALGVSGALLGALLWRVDFSVVLARLPSLRIADVALAAVCSVLVLLARGARLTTLSGVSYGVAVAAVGVQNFFNRVTPMRAGELTLPYLLARQAGHTVPLAVQRMLQLRLGDLLAASLLGAVATTLRVGLERPLWLVSAASLAAGSLCVLVMLPSILRWGFELAASLATRSSRSGLHRRGQNWRAASKQLTATGMVSTGWLAAWSLIIFFLQAALFWFILRAFGVFLGPLALTQGSAVALVGAALPSPGIGTLGTQEASWAVGFAWAGVPFEDAVVTGFGCQWLTLAFATLQGLLSWLALRRNARKQAVATRA